MSEMEQVEPKLISSLSTTFWKRIFPALWIPGVGVVAAMAWLDLLDNTLPLGGKLAIIGIWVGGSVLMAGWSRALHYVWLADDHLVVSGWGGRIRVPLEHIQEISETRFQRVKYIKVSLNQPTAIGRVFRFLAPLALQQPFSDHPVVREIKAKRQALLTAASEDQ
jgi:hypothetical protein